MDEENISWLAGESSTKKIVQKQVILFDLLQKLTWNRYQKLHLIRQAKTHILLIHDLK